MVAGGLATVPVVLRESAETWIGTDGTIRERQTTLSERFANSAARRRWRASGESLPRFQANDSVSAGDGWFPPQYGGDGDIGDGLFSYRQLLSLPASVPALRARLEPAQAALARRQQHGLATKIQPGTTAYGPMQIAGHPSSRYARSLQDLTTITALLSTPVPATVRAALYRVAASLPGVRYDGRATDALGRPGIAVSVGTHVHRMRMIFNRAIGALLQASTLVPGSLDGVKLGAITQTIAAQGIARSLNTLPAAVHPVGHMQQSPPTIAISPRTGTPTTTFSLALHSTQTNPPQPRLSWPRSTDRQHRGATPTSSPRRSHS